ncbi:MAG: TrkH family potassium uptake protein, partial [Pararhodobacter sp.]|nr:TrkH family potassium uptake protein [Pararhodobacter sp.]
LALMGGGVATTAGGVKLLRLYALSRMGAEEMQRLLYPSRVQGGGARMRFLVGRGARLAWLYVMAFAATVFVLVALLLILGMSFETAIIFAAAALTSTGQLAQHAGDSALHWALLNDPARAVLGLGMILGRLEILAVLALLAAQFSRD